MAACGDGFELGQFGGGGGDDEFAAGVRGDAVGGAIGVEGSAAGGAEAGAGAAWCVIEAGMNDFAVAGGCAGADGVGRFQHQDGEAGLGEGAGAGQADDAGAGDDGVDIGGHGVGVRGRDGLARRCILRGPPLIGWMAGGYTGLHHAI